MDVTTSGGMNGGGIGEESIDARTTDDAFELTPRDVSATGSGGGGGGARKWGMWGVLVAVVAALVFVGYSLIGASTYFYNVDEAVEQRTEIGDKRIRLQGNVIEGSVEDGDRVRFLLSFHGVSVQVEHTGEVPDLFGESIPLVVEGRFVGEEFHSNRVLVKHDESYEEDHDDRITEAEIDAEATAIKSGS